MILSADFKKRELGSGFETMQGVSPTRILRIIALSVCLCGAAGCIATRITDTTSRPVQAGMDIFVHSAIESHMMSVACIFPFSSPPESANASGAITASFQSSLIQRRPFRDVKPLPYEVRSDSEALWYARSEGCDLAIVPSILYMMDGTGAMPTRLILRTRILDARAGKVLWDVRQSALSEPGADIDLTWNTMAGEPAQRCRVLAQTLARQFADFLAQPTRTEDKTKKGVGELSPPPIVQ